MKVITVQGSWQHAGAPQILLKFLWIVLQLQTVTMGIYFLFPGRRDLSLPLQKL